MDFSCCKNPMSCICASWVKWGHIFASNAVFLFLFFHFMCVTITMQSCTAWKIDPNMTRLQPFVWIYSQHNLCVTKHFYWKRTNTHHCDCCVACYLALVSLYPTQGTTKHTYCIVYILYVLYVYVKILLHNVATSFVMGFFLDLKVM